MRVLPKSLTNFFQSVKAFILTKITKCEYVLFAKSNNGTNTVTVYTNSREEAERKFDVFVVLLSQPTVTLYRGGTLLRRWN